MILIVIVIDCENIYSRVTHAPTNAIEFLLAFVVDMKGH